jgi:hypothetical protein
MGPDMAQNKRECLVVFGGGSQTGYRATMNHQGQVRIGYLNADGSEGDMRTVEFAWANPNDLAPARRLPGSHRGEVNADGFSQFTVYQHSARS